MPSVADLPEPVDAVVVAIPAAGVPAVIADAVARGCGGAVVLSAGFGEIEAGRGLERELREAALGRRAAAVRPERQRHRRGRLAGADVGRLGRRRSSPGGVAMISQSGNVAVNALGSRRGIRYHTVLSTGNQAVLDASDWLAAICEREGVRSVAMFLEEDGDGERLAESLARCAERGIRVAVLKVGASEAGARAASAHTGAVAGDQRVFRALVEEAGGAWARDPHELLELARVLAEPRARPRGDGGLAILTCSGGDSSIAADEAARLGAELPDAGRRDRASDWRSCCRTAATIGNPLDYTAMIWGDTDLLRRITVTVGADPAIDQLLVLYDHPQGLAPEAAATWAAVRAGIVAGAAETEAATLVASTLPDLIDDEASGELADRGVPAVAGLRTALACAQALRLRRRRPGPPAGDRRGRRAGGATGDPARGAGRRRLAGRDRGEGAAAGGRDRGARGQGGRERGRVRAPRSHELGGPVALKLASPAAAPQERRGRAAARPANGRGGAGRISRALGLAGGRRRRGSWWSGWRRPGSSC